MRREVEMCDSCQGFQVVHGIAGGIPQCFVMHVATGGGILSLLCEELFPEYFKLDVVSYSVVGEVVKIRWMNSTFCEAIKHSWNVQWLHKKYCSSGIRSTCIIAESLSCCSGYQFLHSYIRSIEKIEHWQV